MVLLAYIRCIWSYAYKAIQFACKIRLRTINLSYEYIQRRLPVKLVNSKLHSLRQGDSVQFNVRDIVTIRLLLPL